MDTTKGEILRCSKCVVPDFLPSVHLDADGVCNHCKLYERIRKEWIDKKDSLSKEFAGVIKNARHAGRDYDCLVPLSGGKDSTYALYVMAVVHKLKCLAVTFDNGFLSDHARSNIRAAIKAANADHIYYSINPKLLNDLYRLCLLRTGQFCSVCMRGIALCGEFAARSFKIPLIVSGTGARVTYLSFYPELFEGGDASFLKNVVKGGSLESDIPPRLVSRPTSWYLSHMGKLASKLIKKPIRVGPRSIGIYDYLEFSSEDIMEALKTEMGWESPDDKVEHMDCYVHELPFYIHSQKFPALTPHTFYRSHLVRLGELSRQHAMELEEADLASKQQIPAALLPFLEQIRVSKSEFDNVVSDWTTLGKYRSHGLQKIRSLYHRLTGVAELK